MSRRWISLLALTLLLALHLLVFARAVQENIALNRYDFGGFYKAAWRLLHDPEKIYWGGLEELPAELAQAIGQAVQYRYLPSLALTLTPLTLLDYFTARLVFQFLSLAAVILAGLLALQLFRSHLKLQLLALTLVFLAPLPPLTWSAPWFGLLGLDKLAGYLASGSLEPLAPLHYANYREGNSKALTLGLLTLSYYLATRGRTRATAFTLALGGFDPRYLALALALTPLYWGRRLLKPLTLVALFLAALNLPVFALPHVARYFTEMVLTAGLRTSLYTYAYLPLYIYPLLVGLHQLSGRRLDLHRLRSLLGGPGVTVKSGDPLSQRHERHSPRARR
jgi:hypothetical protein